MLVLLLIHSPLSLHPLSHLLNLLLTVVQSNLVIHQSLISPQHKAHHRYTLVLILLRLGWTVTQAYTQ